MTVATEYLIDLPDAPEALRDVTWSELSPLYEQLASLDEPAFGGETREGALHGAWRQSWLQTWSRLDALVHEAYSLAYWDYSRDTADPDIEARYLRWASEIGPELEAAHTALARRALSLGITRTDMREVLADWKIDVELYRDANKPRVAELEAVSAEYDKLVGALTVEWEGRSIPPAQLNPFMQSPDREVRERAFRKNLGAYGDARGEIMSIFGRMVPLRHAIARESGFDDYMHYRYTELHRRDYTPDDARRWCEAVGEAIVPAVERLREYRRRRLGVDTLRPWDLGAPLFSAEPVKPYDSIDELVAGGTRILGAVDPRMADVIPGMQRAKLLDLENRPNKAPGGYCTTFDVRGLSGIFMNAVGIQDDVTTLLHESGHALHHLLAARHPMVWTRGTRMEAAELASMSMELLAAPYLARPTGFYAEEDAARAEYEHLEDVLSFFPHFATVELFQQWIYTSPDGADPDALDRTWIDLREQYDRGADWSGLDAERAARWYKQAHIFQVPFYYIEYGLAQLGALQVWRNAKRDRGDAVTRYLAALAAGGTVSLTEMYQLAGVKLVFDGATMLELASMVEERLAELREVLE